MIELAEKNFRDMKEWANKSVYESVYPYSIVEGYQKGRIFVDDLEHVKAVLFWHYCGFGYIVGSFSSRSMQAP